MRYIINPLALPAEACFPSQQHASVSGILKSLIVRVGLHTTADGVVPGPVGVEAVVPLVPTFIIEQLTREQQGRCISLALLCSRLNVPFLVRGVLDGCRSRGKSTISRPYLLSSVTELSRSNTALPDTY